MSYKRLTVFQKSVFVLNMCLAAGYLCACLVPYVDTGSDWWIALPGIVFPLLLFALLLLVIYWLVVRSRLAWLNIITVALGAQQILAVFSFHFRPHFQSAKKQNVFRVMQWNVMEWNEPDERNMIENGGHALRPVMMDVVSAQNADVLCFDEFFESPDTLTSGSNISTLGRMGFGYHYYVPVQYRDSAANYGVAIFSRYPMIDTAAFPLNPDRIGEHLIYADIKIGVKIVRVFATHLIPIKFAEWHDERQSNEALYGEAGAGSYRRIFNSLVRGYSYRYYQSQFVGRKIATSPYPAVICGDFNDVPNSSTYFNVKGTFQDAFLKKGAGTGRTTRTRFGLLSPTLRIDYILASRGLDVRGFQVVHVPYSDHYPIVSDLQFR